MKRNFVLFFILSTLLALTYYFEEVQEVLKQKSHELSIATIQFDLANLEKMQLKNAAITRENDRFQTLKNKYPVDEAYLKFVFNQLSNMKVDRFLTPEEIAKAGEESFFDEESFWFSFRFSDGEVRYRLGKKVPHAMTFYLKIEKKRGDDFVSQLVIAQDSGDRPYHITEETRFNSPQKYLRLKGLLELEESFFYDRSLFGSSKLVASEINNIFVESHQHKSFFLNLETMQTTPPVQDGLKYDHAKFEHYKAKIFGLKATEVLEIDFAGHHKLSREVAKLAFNFKRDQLTLYRRFGEQEGYFVTTSYNKTLYELDKKQAQIFFRDVQDFWHKVAFSIDRTGPSKVNLNMKFSNQEILKVIGHHEKDFFVKWDQEADNSKIKGESLNTLFQFIMGKGPFGQAHRVSFLAKEDEKRLAKSPGLDLELDETKLRLSKLGEEMIISNRQKRYKLHYLLGVQASVGLEMSDYVY